MIDDPVGQARTALKQAQSAIQEMPEELSAPLSELLHCLDGALDQLRDIQQRSLDVERNLAIQQALLDDRLLRLENNRIFRIWGKLTATRRNLSLRAMHALERSPLRALLGGLLVPGLGASSKDYAKWVAAEQAASPVGAGRTTSETWKRRPTISLILPVRHGRGLVETLESIRNQEYRHWQLCVALDESCQSHVLPAVKDFGAVFGSVRHVVVQGCDGAEGLNRAVALATGEYLCFLEEAGTLAPLALYYVAEALQSGTFDLLYSDEDSLDAKGRRVRPIFKPDWSPDLLTSCMYVGHLLTVRRAMFEESGGLRGEFGGAHLHDLLLRIADGPLRVHHLNRVLYHSRSGGRTVLDRAIESEASSMTARAIQDAITRRERTAAECIPGPNYCTFLIRRNRPSGDTTAIICSRTPKLLETCLASIRTTAEKAISRIIVVAHEESGLDPALRRVIQQAGATAIPFGGAFNFSRMNNLGVEMARTPNLLFLNDDVKATRSEWAEMLNEQVSREEVGIAGAVLWYPFYALQHAGLVSGIGDGVGHAGRYAPGTALWPWLQVTRNVSAVTGACMAMRRDVFRMAGGFDVGFHINYNDVDLCFRVRETGLSIVCVPVPGLIHRECQSRRGLVRFQERYMFHKRWGELLSKPDPYYSSALAPTEEILLDPNQGRFHRPWSQFSVPSEP